MKLAHKLAFALVLGVLAVVALFGVWQVKREVALLDDDVRRDHRLIGVTAAAAIVKAHSRDSAIELVGRVNASRENLAIRYVSLSRDASPVFRPIVPVSPRELPAPLHVFQTARVLDDGLHQGEHLITYVGVPVADDSQGALELAESLDSRASFVKESAFSVLFASAAVALVCGLIAVFIGNRMVGAPVASLIASAREIGAGNFTIDPVLPRRDELGELSVALARMMSDLEEARRRTQDEMEARLKAVEQLRHAERLATLGQLASVLAHEIGTPLNVIAGHAKLIATGRVAMDAGQKSAQAIGLQCERMTQIVRRILDYARRKPVRRVDVDVNEVIESARSLLEPLAERHHVTLKSESKDGDTRISADANQLQQVITNLVLNAIQASPPGTEVEILAELVVAHSPEQKREVDCLRVSIVDSGCGMPSEVLARAFEPFYTTKPSGEGTGLGLSIVRDIVTEHGGWIDIHSRVARGTRVEVYLPRGPEHA
jgi:two-component system NtrC family sensor kinase